MKVLALTRYSALGASSRLRFFQYTPLLQQSGIELSIEPLFDDEYVKQLQKGSRSLPSAFRAYARRMLLLRTMFEAADLLWIEKDALPWLPAFVERAVILRHKPYVVDYDDAVFHDYDDHASRLVRVTLGTKHKRLMESSAMVIAGNDYLAQYASRAGAARVEMLPTVVDVSRYRVRTTEHTGPVRVGWIGQRSTAKFLEPLRDTFQRLAGSGIATFYAIGIRSEEFRLPMHSIPWEEATEASSISELDIGIMPLRDGPFERGKCGYKLIQYMAAGLPVVASPVGVNTKIVEDRVNGLLASSQEEWEEAIHSLAGDRSLRLSMGRAGRLKVEEQYSLQSAGPKLVSLLREAIAGKPGYGGYKCAA